MSRDMVYEDVPRLDRRVGDAVLAGQNNSTILLGRDRVTTVDTGYGSLESSTKGRGAGAIHLMAGRSGADPNISGDPATVYLSAKNDPDAAAGTSGIGQVQTGVPALIARADCVRIVPRTDFKLSVGKAYVLVQSDGTVVIDGNVSLGQGAADRILRGDTFVTSWIVTHTHPSAVGPTGVPIQPVPDTVYSQTNRVK